jgi:hypothetical protein
MSTKRVAIPYKDVRLRIVGPKEDFFAYRVQRLDLPATLPSTTINELGNSQHAGVITDVPEITATVQAFDVNAKIFSILAGQPLSTFPASGIDVSNFSYCDIIGYVKEANVAEHLKSFHGKYMRVTDFTYTYSVDGESTEEYTFAGSEKRYFANDVVVTSGTLDASRQFTLDYTPNTLKNGNELLSCIINGVWLEEDTEYTVSGTTVTVVSGYGSTGNTALAVYHTSSGVLTWSDISAPATVPVAIRGKNIPVTIGVNNMYRVQSVTIRGTFPNTKVMEMGNVNVVGYIVDPPEITGDISVLDTDNEIVALLTTGAITGSGEVEYGVSEYEERTLQLDVTVRDPSDNTTVVKTVRIPEMRITSDGISSNVGGQTTYTFSFQSNNAQCIVFSGVGS